MLRKYPCTGKDECNAPEGSQLSGLVAIPKLLDVDRRRPCKARSRSEGLHILSSRGTLTRAQRRDIGTALRSYSKLATRNSRGKKEFDDEQ